ncbi:MAG: YbbR-like domain-containing protein [Bacteroidaceae bacterium]|nr:YbbR-like domain-containing protein [Bacteroidaceae bacterium]
MDKEGMRRFWDAVKAFLLTQRSRETAVFLFFVVISALFWLMQTLNGTFEMKMEFPLVHDSVPTNIVITSDMPGEAVVTVSDRGTALMKYVLGTKRLPVTVGFTAHDNGSTYGHVVVGHDELQAQIAAQLLKSTAIVDIDPDTVEYFFCRGVSRRVPVMPNGNIHADELYYLASVSCQPDTVTVWGPQAVLDTLPGVYTQPLSLRGLSKTVAEKVRLVSPRGLKLSDEEVTLTAQVDMYTEKSVSVPITGTNFPAGHSLRTFPGVVTVSFRVGAKDYKRITADNFVITATYEELAALPPNAKLHLQLRSLPDGVSQVRINPGEVDFLIENLDEE